ncbi:hypothetical protein EGI22_03960 [Lacihabitans sp. LS3-19]|uniref:hypothetical protein n=1 Tax=Lacihabitans sp. LS3-19 TaxID=2487335 RepID=UPI0020CDA834|nr:hypothetical protein [Lacihabitans sp. LS3-19]MCP9767052.1 hypothetical protein [Lacihabitans sp. LS3-19]
MNEITIETIFEKAQNFSNSTFELLSLKAIDKSANLMSSLVARILVIIVILFFFININIALALWLGEVLGKTYYGFFAFSILYVFLGVFILPRIYQKLKKEVRVEFIKTLLEETNLNENTP